MSTNQIEGLVGVSLGQIKEMLGINTIVGEPIHTPSGDTILPISRVGVGFVAGGSELRMEHDADHHEQHQASATHNMPFGGGSGGGVSITPIAFLVVGVQGVKVVPLDNQTHLLDKVIDTAPAIIDKMSSAFNSSASSSARSSDNSIPTSGVNFNGNLQ
jgi:sporulation protein YtfJ